MNQILAAVLSILTVVGVLAVIHVPLGSWLHRVFTDQNHSRAERAVYRLVGVDPQTEQRWSVYALSVLGFSLVSIVALWGDGAQPVAAFEAALAQVWAEQHPGVQPLVTVPGTGDAPEGLVGNC